MPPETTPRAALERLAEAEHLSPAERAKAALGWLGHVAGSARQAGAKAVLGGTWIVDQVMQAAPRIPVRDAATLRAQFPGATDDEIADQLVRAATRATGGIGLAMGGLSALPAVTAARLPSIPVQLGAETLGIAVIELKLVAELYELSGRRPPGPTGERIQVYLWSWAEQRGVDVRDPRKLAALAKLPLRSRLRRRLMGRAARSTGSLIPFLAGAAVANGINRHDTGKLARKLRKDLRKDS